MDIAIKAYYDFCENNNLVYQQPSTNSSVIDQEYELARYEISTGEILIP